MRSESITYAGQQTRINYLKEKLAAIQDDTTRPWSDYPCLEWPFALTSRGYAKAMFRGKQDFAHRISFILSKGELGTLHACHHCDNPKCFRPIHLFSGTPKDNAQDMISKGRRASHKGLSSPYCGSAHLFAKFTEETLRMARALRANGSTYKSIADLLGMNNVSVWNALNHKTWKHIP